MQSSQIKSIGYEPHTQKMHVEFKGGGVYEYDSVPPDVHSGFLSATSKGAHFHSTIKGKFGHKQIA